MRDTAMPIGSVKLTRTVTLVGFCLLASALPSTVLSQPPAGEQASAPTPPNSQAAEFFESKVRPLLAANCASCHGAAKQEGGLRLETREEFLHGADDGPIVVGNDPAKSRLMQVVGYAGDTKMPPGGKLPAADIEALSKWISMGTPWPESPGAGRNPTAIAAFDLNKRKAAHWAWKPIRRITPPQTKDRQWPAVPLDSFILARLEEAGLKPAPAADKHALIRRAYFDAIGLPPSPADVEEFVSDSSPKAYEKVVDHLLASPHFGEKWARHWMDLVRYAETRGHEFDYDIPNAWQYRDYLIRAYNADVPYDQFFTEHIAGNLLEKPRLNPADGSNESILGTGFWFLGEEVHSPVDIRQDETDRLANRVDTMSKTFLGLTVACARCHDHKFDAISQKDYYALSGFLLSSAYRQTCFQTSEANRKIAEKLADLQHRAGCELLAKAAAIERPVVERMRDYLLAAREAIIAGARLEAGGKRSAQIAEVSLPRTAEVSLPRIAELAGKQNLDAQVLVAWVKSLRLARRNPQDMLHAFAVIAGDVEADAPGRFAQRMKMLLEPPSSVSLPSASPPSVSLPLQVVIDYAKAGPEQWYTDGFTFGLGPVRPGDVILEDVIPSEGVPRGAALASSAGRPLFQVISRSAARRDAAWNGLKPTQGNELDPGSLAGWERPGRVVRMLKVTLRSGKLYYLVRGSGRAYAAVDSHLMIAGPLHGRTLKEWELKGADWKWVAHNLTPYVGHRVEVEFSPRTADGGLEIAMVVEAENMPALPWQPGGLLKSALADPAINSTAALAKAYQHACEQALQSMEAGRIASARPAAGESSATGESSAVAEMIDWMVRNPYSFSPPHVAARQQIADAARPFLQRRAALIRQIQVVSQTAPAIFEGNGVDENLLKRGSAKLAEAEVPRRFLEALGGAAPGGYGPGSGRLKLARQMLQRDDPFPARVMVNRVWHQLFGAGIVPTVDNFGVLGQAPSHPELLDYLAEDFRSSGWSVKGLIRNLMLSSSYCMSSQVDARAEALDPQNVLLHRMPVRRLTSEAIRDSILAVSNRLDASMMGPSVEVHVTPFMGGRGRPASGPLDGAGRRSIYLKVRRNFLSPMMLAYDAPIPFATVGQRNVSNVPAQALILMNDPFVVEQADLWAKRALAVPDQTAEKRIEGMYCSAFARPPQPQETAAALAFLDGIGETYGVAKTARRLNEQSWADLAHVLFNVKEFVFVR